MDNGEDVVCVKSLRVRRQLALFAGRSKGTSDIGWFDMIKTREAGNGKAVYRRVYIFRGLDL